MSYRLGAGAASGPAARAVAAEQADRALAELEQTDEAVGWRIHQLRKRCKKIRAVARLIRKDLPAYKAHNRAARDIARRLSDERDARVLSELCLHLLDEFDDGHIDSGDRPLVRWFAMYCDLAETAAEPALASIGKSIAKLRKDIELWKVADVDDSTLLEGVRKSLGRAHRQRKKALESGRAAAFHEWRKRAKYHWYHLRLLESRLPANVTVRLEVFDELTDKLGDAHDRSVFLEHLQAMPEFMRSAPDAQIAAAGALRERRRLRNDAIDIAEPVFGHSADEFVRILERAW